MGGHLGIRVAVGDSEAGAGSRRGVGVASAHRGLGGPPHPVHRRRATSPRLNAASRRTLDGAARRSARCCAGERRPRTAPAGIVGRHPARRPARGRGRRPRRCRPAARCRVAGAAPAAAGRSSGAGELARRSAGGRRPLRPRRRRQGLDRRPRPRPARPLARRRSSTPTATSRSRVAPDVGWLVGVADPLDPDGAAARRAAIAAPGRGASGSAWPPPAPASTAGRRRDGRRAPPPHRPAHAAARRDRRRPGDRRRAVRRARPRCSPRRR